MYEPQVAATDRQRWKQVVRSSEAGAATTHGTDKHVKERSLNKIGNFRERN